MSKILVVFGATGQQGGSVIKSVLADSELSKQYKIRAITRDPSKESGKKLQSQGCEVVKGDLSDEASLETAIKGANVVFGVTNYWEKMDAELEKKQGKAIADAAAANNVDYIIWSSLPKVSEETQGKLKHVVHFDGKADVETHIRELGTPAAFFMPAMYCNVFENFLRPGEDGNYVLGSTFNPDDKLPLIAPAEDTGVFVAAALKNPLAFQGQRIIGASFWASPNEIAAGIEKKAGKPVKYHQITDDELRKIMKDSPAVEELTENFIWMREYGYYGKDGQGQYQQTMKFVDQPLTSWAAYLDKTWPWKKE